MPARLTSVDVLRGLTIALMILVNDPGDWAHTYSQLDHSAWNGFTLTDFVFPNFLFLIGVSIILSLQANIARRGGTLDPLSRRSIALRILRRAGLLFLLDLFIASFPHFHWAHIRIFGVLTRIALCYLVVAFLCLFTRRIAVLAGVAAVLLLGYWAIMRFVPVPGFGIPTHTVPLLDPEHNLAALLDRAFDSFTRRWLHTGSLYNGTHDPEGLLSTLPAFATTLIGCIAGLTLAPERPPSLSSPGHATPGNPRATSRLLLAGLTSLLAGLLWNPWFPINKNLWTSSYVLFAGGVSLVLLAVAHWTFDLRRFHETRWGRPLTLPWLIFGSNAITAYVFAELVVEILFAINVPNPADPAHPLTAWLWPYRHLFAAHGSTQNTSLAFALAFTALCLVPNIFLWRRRIFLKL